MSFGKGGGQGSFGNGGSTTDTSQYGMNNNQYNQSYPSTSIPQPVTSQQFGQGPVNQPGQGMQFNQPNNQPGMNQNYLGGWGKGGGFQNVGGPVGTVSPAQNQYNQYSRVMTGQDNTSPQNLYSQYAGALFNQPGPMSTGPGSEFNNSQGASNNLQSAVDQTQLQATLNPISMVAPVFSTSMPVNQLTQPGVYSGAQANSSIGY